MGVTKISNDTLAELKNKSVYGLPDEPNLTAVQMQAKLMGWGLDTTKSLFYEINRIVDEVNANVLRASDVVVDTWVEDTTYTGYGYKGTITISGAASTSFAEVVFGLVEAVSGNYAPLCVTTTNAVYIYSKVNTTITVAQVIVHKA